MDQEVNIEANEQTNHHDEIKDNVGIISHNNVSSTELNSSTSTLGVHRGTLNMRIGPMYSQKTTWLNGELTALADQGFSVIKIVHIDDKRDDVASNDDSGTTHNSSYTSLTQKIHCVRAEKLKDIDITDYNVVGIDEAQFYSDLVEVVEDWVENKGIHVRVSGLDGDKDKKKFGQTLDLIPMCDEVIKKTARCRLCLDELQTLNFHGNILGIAAPFTRKICGSNAQKDVGGKGKYLPVCRFHHTSQL